MRIRSPFKIIQQVASAICKRSPWFDHDVCLKTLCELAAATRATDHFAFHHSGQQEANFGCHLLTAASYLNDTSNVKKLLDYGINAGKKSHIFGYATRAAAFRGHTELVELLMLEQPNAAIRDEEQMKCWAIRGAIAGGQLRTLDALLSKEKTPSNMLQAHLEEALPGPCALIYEYIFEYLQSCDASTTRILTASPDLDSSTLLSTAARDGNTAVMAHLLDSGAPVNGTNSDHCNLRSPLWAATRWGDVFAVQLLLREGADVNVCVYGKTPLQNAAARAHLAMVRLLLIHGAEVNRGVPSALVYAVELEHESMKQLLVGQGGVYLD